LLEEQSELEQHGDDGECADVAVEEDFEEQEVLVSKDVKKSHIKHYMHRITAVYYSLPISQW